MACPHVSVLLLTLMAPALAHAQCGGLLKKKAVEAPDALRDRKPPYEEKGQVWKACVRAGKPVSISAMQMAQAWLKEL